MTNNQGRKNALNHWNEVWQRDIKARLPSRLNVDVFNITRLIVKYVRPGDNYLEIGCAPGKLLAWVASVLKAEVTGLDYSTSGITKCQILFDTLGIKANLHHDDLFNHRLALNSFDIVTSFGVVEHFDNARLAVQRHLDLVKPGGVALITVPNYTGIYGALQSRCDAANLAMHNLDIMTPAALTGLVDIPCIETLRAYPFGSMSPWLISLEKRLPHRVAQFISYVFNTLGLLQPLAIEVLSPMLVLEVRKSPAS
jgi:2-polyprenyl-3-methyl-5-hydroxy-6-metoxy-1,4-benzoquinol methylase